MQEVKDMAVMGLARETLKAEVATNYSDVTAKRAHLLDLERKAGALVRLSTTTIWLLTGVR